MKHKAIISESKKQRFYLILIIASLMIFFLTVILIDRIKNFGSIERNGYVEDVTFIWVAFVILVVLGFRGLGVAIYHWSKPPISEVKKIDYIWYFGAVGGLVLSLLDHQERTSRANNFVFQSAIFTSHAALRDFCSRSDLGSSVIEECEKVEPILVLEAEEILELISEGTLERKWGEPKSLNIDYLKQNSDALFAGPFVSELLGKSIEALSEEQPLAGWQVFTSGSAWLLIFGSILGIRLSRTDIEVGAIKGKS